MKNICSFTKTTSLYSLAALFVIILLGNNLNAQKTADFTSTGITINRTTSGNGHGAYYGFGAALRKNRSYIAAEGLLQQKSGVVNGYRLYYSFAVNQCKNNSPQTHCLVKRELSFFTYASYINNANLSNATLASENNKNEDNRLAYKSLKLNTVEFFSGFCFTRNQSPNFSYYFLIGAGYYNNLNLSMTMYHDKSGFVLTTGLGIKLFK